VASKCRFSLKFTAPNSTKPVKPVTQTESLYRVCSCAVDPENIWQLYDPNRDIWLTLPVLPSEVRNLSQSGVALVIVGVTGPHDGPALSFGVVCGYGKYWWPVDLPAMNSTSTAEYLRSRTDPWDFDLPTGHDYPCIGFVIDGVVHVVDTVLNEVQVLENLNDKWQRSRSLNEGLITVVNGSLYGMTYHYREIYKEERGGICKFVVSASQFDDRTGFAMMGFRDDIYVIGGVVCPGGWNRGRAKKVSDVDVLVLGNENEKPVWKKVASMTRCQGVILGCAELRI
ncbi:F-box/kelch-repeat protein SKIP30, partial [Tanacetum coccineum]